MRVNKQQAKLLKKAAYDVPCTQYYHPNNGLSHYWRATDMNCNIFAEDWCSAPTLHEVTDWILTKDLHISVFPDVNMHAHKFTWFIYRRQHNQWQLWDRGGNVYDTPHAALSAAVNQALTQLLTGNELPIK
jgi:hypothetical protein